MTSLDSYFYNAFQVYKLKNGQSLLGLFIFISQVTILICWFLLGLLAAAKLRDYLSTTQQKDEAICEVLLYQAIFFQSVNWQSKIGY